MSILLLLVCLSLLCAQEENVVVDAKSLANIVMEVNELKENNKKLSREVSFLKERVLGTRKPFSVLQNGRYIIPLIVRTPKIATHGEIDPLKIKQLRDKIAVNLRGAKIITQGELQQSKFITQLLADYTKKLPYRFWYVQFSFSLLRRDYEEMPFHAKLYTKNSADFTPYYLATKNGGNWLGYNDRHRITKAEAHNKFSMRKFNTINACLFTDFSYDVKTQYRYISLFYKNNGEEVALKSPFSSYGFPVTNAKVHPQSVIFLELEKNSPRLWGYLEKLEDISIGPCIIFPKEYEQLQKKQLCFAVDRHRSKIDDIDYDYTFEADNIMIAKDDVSVEENFGYLLCRVWVPNDTKIFTVRMGYLYKKFNCNDVFPGSHLRDIKRVSLPTLQKHIAQFSDPEKKSTCLVKALGTSKPSRKVDIGMIDEIKDFVSHLKTWKNARSTRVSNIIEKFTHIINKAK
ncbi:hypothetical protein [Candidatus Uabimicrobium amorphum]|uniref:Uncharacterized protein n=1 Tax=Uabimicrobium amorphum TaxID=2596890 RepID=A0A5S9INZ6_UABAM|nr:hypothetical protein [Candidatus Uabimicrobium amorphum]BBM85224.1 hypothetical protein UABAM_03587 [Candidatus Uabimicrobium amorphum]